jgi:hypothetical protein
MKTTTNQAALLMIDAFGTWIESYLEKGWKSYLMTFMFNPLSGNPNSIVRQMSAEVERVYSTLLTRVVRNPRSPKKKGTLPVLIGFPDLPVFKHKKGKLDDVRINDGLHYHAMLLLPLKSRLNQELEQHIKDNEDIYLGRTKTVKERGMLRKRRAFPKLQRIHIQATTHTPGAHTSYGLKAMRNLPYDDLLIMPKSDDEPSDRVVEEISHEPISW